MGWRNVEWKYTQQIKDLKFRLKRLSDDQSMKDERITKLQTQFDDVSAMLVEVQKHVDESKLEEIREELEQRKRNATHVRYSDKHNVVTSDRDDTGPKSVVCVIQ